MSGPAVAERPLLFAGPPHQLGGTTARRLSKRSGGGRLTLEQTLDGVWEGLRAGGAADCPVCEGPMRLCASGAAARCGECGSTLG